MAGRDLLSQSLCGTGATVLRETWVSEAVEDTLELGPLTSGGGRMLPQPRPVNMRPEMTLKHVICRWGSMGLYAAPSTLLVSHGIRPQE